MTISSTTRKAGPFIGNGTTTAFPFAYKVFQASDLLVVRLDTTLNIEHELTLNTDYTVTLNLDQDSNPGGTVNLLAALATGYTLTLTSDLANLQPTDLTNQGGFYPDVINDALDRATIQIQQLQEQTDRSLKVAVSSTADTTLPPPAPNDLIGWDATGNALVNVDPGSIGTVVAYATAYCDVFIGNGITTSWTLTRNPAVLFNLDVSINGSTQEPTRDYTLSGTTFTMTTPPPIGARVVVKYKEGLPNFNGDSQDVRFLPGGTGAVARSVQSKLREWVSVTDFGAVGNGVTDDRQAIQNAINYVVAAGGGSGGVVFFPDTTASYRITSNINVPSFVTLIGQGKGTTIKKDFQNGFAIVMNSVNYSTIKDLRVLSTVAATTSPSGAIGIQDCGYCNVDNVEIVDREQFGIWLWQSSYCKITNNSVNGAKPFGGDNCDIGVFDDSNWNIVEGNHCYGGLDSSIGITVQDPYTTSQPTGNQILNNFVGAHNTYGIAVYVTNNYNTKTKIIGNEVRDITGTGLLGTSGGGIYIQSAGGTICSENTVSNCCISTTNFFTLAPGAIGVTSPAGTPAYPVIISNNSLSSVRGPCISAITNGGPVTIDNNVCTLNCADAAANPRSIYASNSPRCTISNNTINHTSPSPAIDVIARSATIVNDVAILSNSVKASERGIYVTPIDTSSFESMRMIGNYIEGPSVQSIQLNTITRSTIASNIVYGASIVFELNACPSAMIEGNSFVSADTANPVLFFLNNNSGSFVSENNTIVGRLSNSSGNGTIISRFGTTAPVGGNNWAVGDRVIQSNPVVGQPKGWRCTVAGNPGTWVSEGNL